MNAHQRRVHRRSGLRTLRITSDGELNPDGLPLSVISSADEDDDRDRLTRKEKLSLGIVAGIWLAAVVAALLAT